MQKRHVASATVLVLVAGMAFSTGCVTKKVFRRTIAGQDEKIEGVRSGVEENERRIGGLKEETSREINRLDGKTSEALMVGQKADSHAALAEKLAKGTVLWEATLNNDQVKFDLNRYSLKPTGQTALDEVAEKIKSTGHQVYIEIEGHTDSTGTPEYNLSLGQKRAEAVRQYLHDRQQIPLHLIETVSFGETRPVAENSSRDGRAQNRRVVIRVLDPIAPIIGEVAKAGDGVTGEAPPMARP